VVVGTVVGLASVLGLMPRLPQGVYDGAMADENESKSGGASRVERKFEVSVDVWSETHTKAELASFLPMTPDATWEKGESYTYRGRERQRKQSRWAAIERDGDVVDWRETVERLVVRLRPIEAAFRSLPPEVCVALSIAITEDNGVFGFGLDKHHVQFMANIGAELDMSVVAWSGEPRPAT